MLVSCFTSGCIQFVAKLPVRSAATNFMYCHQGILRAVRLSRVHFGKCTFRVRVGFATFGYKFRVARMPIVFVGHRLNASGVGDDVFKRTMFNIVRLG